jgi:predicted small secreted protein
VGLSRGESLAFGARACFVGHLKLDNETGEMIRKTVLIASLILAMLLCTSCNTVKGVGKDITAVGEAAEDVVD